MFFLFFPSTLLSLFHFLLCFYLRSHRQYPKWLERRVHVVAPNKRAFSGSLTMYHDIKRAMQLYFSPSSSSFFNFPSHSFIILIAGVEGIVFMKLLWVQGCLSFKQFNKWEPLVTGSLGLRASFLAPSLSSSTLSHLVCFIIFWLLYYLFGFLWICEANKSNVKFSEIVKEAKKRGYTEPDPRDDLSGMDFARKGIIIHSIFY